jgi:hypothetical protein
MSFPHIGDQVPPAFTPFMIEGRCRRKASNKLVIDFREGPGDPIATAVQGEADGMGRKMGMLFGFKNGGPGKHVLTAKDGRKLVIESGEMKPTPITTIEGELIATVNRVTKEVPVSVAVTPEGLELLRFASDPGEPFTGDIFRSVVHSPDGTLVANLEIIRRAAGWTTLTGAFDAAYDLFEGWNQAGASLPIPIQGARVYVSSPVTPIQREVLYAACVDIALGIRPYIPEMN